MKRQFTEHEKIAANDANDKGLILNYINSSYNLTTKNKQLNRKMSRRPKQTFLQIRNTDGQ